MDYDAVVRAMLPEHQERLTQMWKLLASAPSVDLNTDGPHSVLPDDDAAGLLAADIVEPVSRAHGVVLGSAFTVVEEKNAGLRRRFILWPKSLNQWIESQGYRSKVDLDMHPFPYVLSDYGGITDLTTSFFQVALPPHLRALFAFKTKTGRFLQMKVLPMGLSISPEIMHKITSTIAGHPRYSITPSRKVQVNVWIDNIQFCGTQKAVDHAIRRVQRFAEQCHVTLNEEETMVSQEYTFAGITFNHREKTVAIGPKTARKIQADDTSKMTMADLERIMGRLWFAARILDYPVHTCWWFLKSVRRLFSKWSRGLVTKDTPVRLGAAAQRELEAWAAAAKSNTPRRINPAPTNSREFDVYTDATLTGWGAVCIDRLTKQTAVVGSKWSIPSQNINAAETRAVACALAALRPTLNKDATIHLRVDNTSAISALKRGFARSHAINEELSPVFAQYPYRVDVEYIKSAGFSADLIYSTSTRYG
ncbi:TcC31.12 [Angomonas deanei]|nr:TcC31.12 [Angomonas deanei]|eukprot:EPY38285.1 TcC31.12 [Angomonas deanei]